jgi:hypothetical protein
MAFVEKPKNRLLTRAARRPGRSPSAPGFKRLPNPHDKLVPTFADRERPTIMKALALIFLACLGAAWAQTNPPAGETPQERLKRMASEAVSAGATPAPSSTIADIPDNAVVAVCENAPLTMGLFKKIMSSDAKIQQSALGDPPGAARWWCGMQSIARMAEADKLDQQSPTKEQLEVLRIFALAQAEMNIKLNTELVEQSEIEKYYEDHKEQYKQVRVKAIYIAFGDAAGAKQSRTEEQAKEKATELRAQIRTGADFVKLVKENSDDVTSRDKDGDFATFKRGQNVPDAIAAAVFGLQQGEVSEPVRQPSGYYLLRAEEVSYAPLPQEQTGILMTLRSEKYTKWLQDLTNAVKIQYPNPDFQPAAKGGK